MAQRPRRGDKRLRQVSHALRRARDRYDLDLNEEDLNAMVRQIQTKTNAQHIYTQSNRVTLWLVQYQGQQCRVVYDRSRKVIVSFLPKESNPLHPAHIPMEDLERA